MKKVTQNRDIMFLQGERVRLCREFRSLTQDELIEKIEMLPANNGQSRNAKQISYIENGTRRLSAEYALLISQALDVRIDYLLLKDDFMTNDDRATHVSARRNAISDLVIELIKQHNYDVQDVTSTMPIYTNEHGKKYRPPTFALISPNGSKRFITPQDLNSMINSISEYIDYQCAVKFKKMIDGGLNIYKWEVD